MNQQLRQKYQRAEKQLEHALDNLVDASAHHGSYPAEAIGLITETLRAIREQLYDVPFVRSYERR